MSTDAWIVRAGQGGQRIEDFAKGVVAIGWGEVGSLHELTTLSAVKQRLRDTYGTALGGSFTAAAAVLHKFRNVTAKGDGVATYDPATRQYLLGSVTSEYRFEPTALAGYPHIRRVRWNRRVGRDDLPVRDRHSLGAAFTLFRIPASTWTVMKERSTADSEITILAPAIEAEPVGVEYHGVLEEHVANILQKAGFEYSREQPIGGLRPDFVVTGPRGQTVIVEAKAWPATRENLKRASHQAQQYLAATKVDRAFVVLAGLEHDLGYAGVVSPHNLVDALRELFSEVQKKSQTKTPEPSTKERLVFAAMPFDGKYDDTYFVAMSHAARQVGAACERVDHVEFSGDIVDEIKRLIRASVAVIVDLSESKPNVLYEAGFAHALPRPVVHISSTDLATLPFDVRNWNTLPYAVGATTALRDPLAKRLKAAMGLPP